MVCMIKSNVYGKGFLIRTESGHHDASDILRSEIRPSQCLRYLKI